MQKPQADDAHESGKRGAPPGNANGMRHGLQASRLPKGCSYIVKATNRFRAELEAAVLELRGEVALIDAAHINSAMRWERHAQLCQRWLYEGEELTPEQKLAFSRDVARASSERDRCLKALGLDTQRQGDVWAAIDALGSQTPPKKAIALDEATEPQEQGG